MLISFLWAEENHSQVSKILLVINCSVIESSTGEKIKIADLKQGKYHWLTLYMKYFSYLLHLRHHHNSLNMFSFLTIYLFNCPQWC